MPTYENKSAERNNFFDRLQGADADYPECPVCSGEVVRIFSVTGLRFNSSGFH